MLLNVVSDAFVDRAFEVVIRSKASFDSTWHPKIDADRPGPAGEATKLGPVKGPGATRGRSALLP